MTAHDQCFRILLIRYYVKITVWVIWIYSSKIRRNTIYNIISSFVGFSYKLINTCITIYTVSWSKTYSHQIRFTFGSYQSNWCLKCWALEVWGHFLHPIQGRGVYIYITSKIQRFTVYIIYLRSPMITIFAVYLFSTPFTWTLLVDVCTYQNSIAITLTVTIRDQNDSDSLLNRTDIVPGTFWCVAVSETQCQKISKYYL